jgi:hypothetical protein
VPSAAKRATYCWRDTSRTTSVLAYAIKRAIDGFVNGYDGPAVKLRQAGFDEVGRTLAAEWRILDRDFLNEMLRKLRATLALT